ncbi:hypothetical protein [Chitinophaga defluvii]|uniref:Uncharacterized protein n=1 Tax=Chitinophaga defluvii TaxID=3163343 RepID=A0ABV2TBZ8_9BACT
MKLLKPNVASIIAFLTISITLVANANRFKHNRLTLADFVDCYTTVTYKDSSLGCNAFNLVINQSLCPGLTIVGKGASLFIDPVDPEIECPPTGTIFCCAKIRSIATVKCGQFNEITQIYCKEAQ